MRLIGLAVVLIVSLILGPLAVEAQPTGKTVRVGILSQGFPSPGPSPLVQHLRALGWIEGQNISFERRFDEGKRDRLAALAAELVRLKVDVIVAVDTPTAKAAQGATDRIPIVFSGVADPIGVGLVASLAHPGRNITGFTTTNVELTRSGWSYSRPRCPASHAWLFS